MESSKNYKLLKKIINDEDPLGLIDIETPESLNEYEPELREIFKGDIETLSEKQLSGLVYNVFKDFFGENQVKNKEHFDRIAKKFIDSSNP